MAEENNPEELLVQGAVAPQFLYADRILNIAFGPVVSKLTLANEIGANSFAPTFTLVLPTSALIDAVKFIKETTSGNSDLKTGLIGALGTLTEQIKAL